MLIFCEIFWIYLQLKIYIRNILLAFWVYYIFDTICSLRKIRGNEANDWETQSHTHAAKFASTVLRPVCIQIPVRIFSSHTRDLILTSQRPIVTSRYAQFANSHSVRNKFARFTIRSKMRICVTALPRYLYLWNLGLGIYVLRVQFTRKGWPKQPLFY